MTTYIVKLRVAATLTMIVEAESADVAEESTLKIFDRDGVEAFDVTHEEVQAARVTEVKR